MLIKILAGGYIIILLTIVILADIGALSNYISFYQNIPFGDTIGHFFLMGTLSFVINLALKIKTVKFGKNHLQLGSLLVFTFVILEEFTQIFIATRTFSFSDMSADLVGIILFGFLAKLAYNKATVAKPN